MHRPTEVGKQKVVPCPDIPKAPASSCNIIHCEPINCESKLHLKSPLADCDVDYLLKNQNAEVYRMRSTVPGSEGVLATGIAGHDQS